MPEEYLALLGRTWLRSIEIDLNSIDEETCIPELQINTFEPDEIISKFRTVFQDKIGCTLKFKVSLQLRENTKPVFCRERDVLHALLDRVD